MPSQAQAELFPRPPHHFWQKRFYDFNVFTREKRVEKLKYMHRNPVKRRLVHSPELFWNYDGPNIIEERDGSGTLLAQYTQGAGIDEPLAMLRGGNTYQYEQDGLGSVTSLTNASGSVAESYTYDSYGKSLAGGTNVVNPFRYTAREWDDTVSLYYYRARYYLSDEGRFSTEDPVRFQAGNNFYEYAFNSPARFIDPSGNQPALAAASAAPAASAAGTGLTLIQGGAGATTLGATFGAAIETGSAGGPIGVLVATNLALLAYDANQAYKLGMAYGWWGDGKIPLKSQAQLNREGTEKAQKACEGKQNHDDDWCDRQYQQLLNTCRALKSASCYAQALEWYAACRAKRPLPPFPYTTVKTN